MEQYLINDDYSKDIEQVLYLGDIHGNFEWTKGEIKRRGIGNNVKTTYIIQVGDFGIGFNEKTDIQTLLLLNKFCKLRNIIFIAIRGNHDNPSFFKGNHMYSNLKLVEDYTTMEIYERKYLFVGGAVSIDRKYRMNSDRNAAKYGSNRESYWKDEIFYLDEDKLANITGIDVIITHSCPEYCYPDNRRGFGSFVDSFAEDDILLHHDLTVERTNITKMFDILQKNGNNIAEHYYGHFHNTNVYNNGYTLHILLNINEFR
jgi:DNA repair exonuclease SbcCD nuclease subunit